MTTQAPVIVVAATFLIALAGCGPTLQVSTDDPSFGSAETYTRPIAIGGVVWSADRVEREPEVCAILEAALWERLSKDVGADRMKGFMWISETLDSASRQRVLKSLDATGSIDSTGQDLLSTTYRDSGVLIIFGRMLYDKIESSTDYSTDEKGLPHSEITRTVRMSLSVFDPIRGRNTWQAVVSNHKTKDESADDGLDLNLGAVIGLFAVASLVDLILDFDEEDPPPVMTSEPELMKIVWGLYGELSHKLVAKEKK